MSKGRCITSRPVPVTKILNSAFSEESLEEYWTQQKESRKSGMLGCERGAWVQLACTDCPSGVHEKQGMLPVAVLLVILLESANDRIIKKWVLPDNLKLDWSLGVQKM